MKRIAALVVLAFLFLGTAGCVSLLNRDYRAPLQPHGEAQVENETGDYWEAQNYSELKQCLIAIVNQAKESDVIRLYNYPGDLRGDIARACQEVMREDPFGAYAVNYFKPELQPLVGYTELRVSVSYLAGRELQIPRLQGKADLADMLRDQLRGFSGGFVVQMGYYLASDWDVSTLAKTVYFSQPAWAVGHPKVTCTPYPEMGFQHILDITLSWPDSAAVMQEKAAQAQESLDSLLADAPRDWSAPETALWLYDKLAKHIQFDDQAATIQDGQTETAAGNDLYGALVDGKTLSEGYALAYKRVCDEWDIPCELVEGTRDGEVHFWNIIELDGGYYHVDLATDDKNSKSGKTNFQNFLLNDEAMGSNVRWNTSAVPRCDASEWSFARAAELLQTQRGIELRDLPASTGTMPV